MEFQGFFGGWGRAQKREGFSGGSSCGLRAAHPGLSRGTRLAYRYFVF